MKFLVRCPKCHQTMQYEMRSGEMKDKVKRCVYCGRFFKVHSNMNSSRIVKRL